jgi:hypothetical protein
MPEIMFIPVGFDIPKQMKECADCGVRFDALASVGGVGFVVCSDCWVK